MEPALHVKVENLGKRSRLVSDKGVERYIDVGLRSSVALKVARPQQHESLLILNQISFDSFFGRSPVLVHSLWPSDSYQNAYSPRDCTVPWNGRF